MAQQPGQAGQLESSDHRKPFPGEPTPDLTLEKIRDLIIEAYGDADKKRRESLPETAEDLVRQLVCTYRAKGLETTAENIGTAVSRLRRRHQKRSS